MEYQRPRPTTVMESEHHQGCYAPSPRLPPQNSSVCTLPDCSNPPPSFVANNEVPPTEPCTGLSNPCLQFVPWGSQLDIRRNMPLHPQAVPDYNYHEGGPFHGPVNAFAGSTLDLKILGDQRVKDKLWLKQFMYEHQVYSESKDNTETSRCIPPQLKIFEAKYCFDQSATLFQDLENLEKEMMDRIESSNTEEWQEMCALVSTKKMHLEENLRKISDPVAIEHLNKALMKRHKKRLAMKKRHTRHREEMMLALKRQQQLHLSIDSWLEEMQQAAEKVKLEESLKQQADSVLSEVTRKKAEARRQLSLLSMLVKLRRIRVQASANRGEKTSIELVHIFENVIEKLQKYWSDQLKDYNLEEKGLRVMLEEATEDSSRVKKTLRQRIMSQWQKVLFGRNTSVDPSLTVAERDIAEFIKIRHEWDKFVVPSGVPMASSIPIGWVLPVKPSSEEWENLLEANNSKHGNK